MNWRDITHPWAGGAEVHIHEVAKRWVKRGHEVTLLCGKYQNCLEDEEIEGVKIMRRGGLCTVYMQAMKEYVWNLRKRGYDCVIDDINGVPFFTPTYVKGPKVAIIHHLVKDIFFREMSRSQAALGYTAEKTIGTIYRNTPFIAVSESTKKDLLNSGIPDSNINVIHNGVDHEFYKPSPHTKNPYPLIVYVGRIRHYKNIDHIIRAMKLIIETKHFDKVKFVVAGKGDSFELKRLAVEHNLDGSVEFRGGVCEEEKIALLDRAWIYVTASSREGWGLTVTEANACGTPVVAYNVPGLRDSVVDGVTGLLVEKGNVKALADAMIRVLQDEVLRCGLRENALKYAEEFSWDKTAEEVMKVVKDG
jgi:glycosyltransferase involved in cell wall biosynthesis